MTIQPIDGWRFFVKCVKMDCVVDLEHGKCDCGVYAVEKIPCSHAIAAGTSAGLHISTLVCPVYSKDFLFAGYSENIYPCVGQQVEEHTCFPPDVAKWTVVDLEHGKCDCGVYAVEKIPCSHAIAAGTSAGLHISTLVCPLYSKDFLFAGNSENIYPCVGQQVEERTCFPPDEKRVEKIPCSHAIAAGTSAGLHNSTLVCLVYSKDFLFAGYSENIYPCVGQQVEERTCFPSDVKRDAQNASKLAIRNHNVSRPVFSLPEDLQLSRLEGRPVSRPGVFLPEGCPVSRPGFFLPEDLQVSHPVFSLPEDLQLSRPEGHPVSRPGFFLPEDLQVSRPVFSLPEDLQLSRPEGRPVSRPVFSLPEDLQLSRPEDIEKIEGGRSNGNSIYVNQSFVSKDALLSELRLTAVRFKFSFRIYKSTKTLLVTTCPVSGCQWKVRASVKHGTNTFWVTKYVEKHTCSAGDRLAQRRHCTPKYVGRLFIDRVGIIDGLNPQHITDAMKNMFGMTLDYTTSYRALLYAQTLIADTMTVQPIDGWRFFVKGGKMDCVVDLEHGKCDCGVCAVEKIPCSHAIAAGTSVGYSENIYPCVRQQVEEHTCFPPDVKHGPGRQKKSRWQSWLELSRMRGRKPQNRGVDYLLSVRSEIADTMTVQPIDGCRFLVKGGKMDCVVYLEHGKCDCGVYAVEKIPCSHAIAAGTSAGYSENIYILVLDNKLRNTHAFLRMKSVVRKDRRNQDGNLD
ncbi:hypothetical protein F2Q69_00053666 [Brassica cretica]|uniref:SWIM-type domain-containing protein n=1 Tax=Brassica cretica TaxID=69181 RepID=A0A8S9MUA0_BRACR|nr:hypothetical protein F2Q69_00053666 [Brassica cretica]